MVEQGNKTNPPPGYDSGNNAEMASSSEPSCNLLNQWMNSELNLDFAAITDQNLPPVFQQQLGPNSASISVNNGKLINSIGMQQQPSDQELNTQIKRELDLDEKDLDFYDQDQESLNLLIQQLVDEEQKFTNSDEKLSGNEMPLFRWDSSPVLVWGVPMDIDNFKMDEVFQVDQSDLVQSPTLAELNSNEEPFFELEFGTTGFMKHNCDPKQENNNVRTAHSFSKENDSTNNKKPAAAAATISSSQTRDDLSGTESSSSASSTNTPELIYNNSTQPQPKTKHVSKIMKTENANQKTLETTATVSSFQNARTVNQLSVPSTSSAMMVMDNDGQSIRIKKKNHVSSQPSLTHAEAAGKAKQNRNRLGPSISSISSLSSVSNDDEGFGSQAEDDDDEDDSEDHLSSDDEDLITPKASSSTFNDSTNVTKSNKSNAARSSVKSSRSKKYFWQYNIQSKGPKVGATSRVVLPPPTKDPHVLDDARDPVFSAECHLEGVKHAGKARRGDGNDLTPCPRKLCNIGSELKSLNRMINDLTPVSDVPFNARPKSRKEKNKLASRACRLKKKAQHEANKLKLYGLQREHQLVNTIIKEARRMLRKEVQFKAKGRANEQATVRSECLESMDQLLNRTTGLRVAGCAAEFVNTVLEKVASGNPAGGLDEI